MSARVIEINGEMCILSVTRDIGDWKEAEMQIQHLHEELLTAYDETLPRGLVPGVEFARCQYRQAFETCCGFGSYHGASRWSSE